MTSSLPPGNPGEPTAAASSHADNTAEVKATEAVVPIYKEEEEPTPKNFGDYTLKSAEAEKLEEEKPDAASEEQVLNQQKKKGK